MRDGNFTGIGVLFVVVPVVVYNVLLAVYDYKTKGKGKKSEALKSKNPEDMPIARRIVYSVLFLLISALLAAAYYYNIKINY
ncbi:hypothetical protein Dip518_000148 [Parelusimicrobium proximum]|uniref:hypothetical protein n=1 Tax=Parelusimicrobium proximum TaxID=3228953 RepID=UPI003D17B679